MKRGALLLLVPVVLLAGWSPSGAAVEKWTIDAGVDGFHAGFDNGLHAKDIWKGKGVRLGLVIHPAFQVEAVYTSLSTEVKGAPGSEYKQDAIGLRVMAVYKASEDVRVNPYMLAGGGLENTKFNPAAATGLKSGKDQSFFEDVGIGVRIAIWKGLHANSELFVRHQQTLGMTESNAFFTYGVSWLIGRKK
jgi:hypothetical protein